jgi:hypothetical protein
VPRGGARGFRGLSLDLRSSAVVPAPDPSSEAEEKLLLDWLGAVKQVRVPPGIAAKLEPVVPVSRLAAVVHCCSCNRLPSSVDVTSEIRAGVRGTRRQDCCCGRGKRSVKWVRNATSQVISKLRDATSAMSLSLPAMDPMVSGPACTARWKAARPRRSRPAVGAWEWSAMRVVHATVGVLSDHTPVRTYQRSTSC